MTTGRVIDPVIDPDKEGIATTVTERTKSRVSPRPLVSNEDFSPFSRAES